MHLLQNGSAHIKVIIVCMVFSCLYKPETVVWRKIHSIICTGKYDLISKSREKIFLLWQNVAHFKSCSTFSNFFLLSIDHIVMGRNEVVLT